MTEDGNACILFYVADELIGATWNDEIDVAILIEERGDDATGCEELD